MSRGGGGAHGGPRRREQSDLYATVLEVVKRHHGQARVTRVSYGAGMPVDRLRVLLDRMTTLGFVRSLTEEGRTSYYVTPRGQQFLDVYWRMRAFTDLLEPGPPGTI